VSRDRRTGEPIVLTLAHSPEVYRRRYRFPFGYLFAFPQEAFAALGEIVPWEALGVSLVATTVIWVLWGSDLGTSLRLSVTLLLAIIQMFRAQRFVTPHRVVRTRGLFFRERLDIRLQDIIDARVETPADEDAFGDIVLALQSGEHRLRAVHQPRSVLDRLLVLREAARQGP